MTDFPSVVQLGHYGCVVVCVYLYLAGRPVEQAMAAVQQSLFLMDFPKGFLNTVSLSLHLLTT